MEESSDHIRRIAAELHQSALDKQAVEAQAAQRAVDQHRANLAEKEHRKIEVSRLCGQFAVWAAENDVPYNSPTPFAPGWLLGIGEGPPSYSISHQGTQTSGNSRYSLLVKSSGSIRELIVYDVGKHRRMYHLFSRSPQLERYSLSSIEESIARFSVAHGIDWQA